MTSQTTGFLDTEKYYHPVLNEYFSDGAFFTLNGFQYHGSMISNPDFRTLNGFVDINYHDTLPDITYYDVVENRNGPDITYTATPKAYTELLTTLSNIAKANRDTALSKSVIYNGVNISILNNDLNSLLSQLTNGTIASPIYWCGRIALEVSDITSITTFINQCIQTIYKTQFDLSNQIETLCNNNNFDELVTLDLMAPFDAINTTIDQGNT